MVIKPNIFLKIIVFLMIFAGIFCVVGCVSEGDSGSNKAPVDDPPDGSNQDDDIADDDYSDDDDYLGDNDDDSASYCESEALIHFDLNPKSRNIPFPSLAFTRTDENSPTGFRVNINGSITKPIDRLTAPGLFVFDDLNNMDGFATAGAVWFSTPDQPDRDFYPVPTIPTKDDPVFCISVDPEGHKYRGRLWGIDISYDTNFEMMLIRPHLPFGENSMAACVVTDRLQTRAGECYSPPEHLRYVMEAEGDPRHPEYEILEPLRESWAPYFNELFKLSGLDKSEISSVAFFPTQYHTRTMLSIRETLEDMAATQLPQVSDWTRLDPGHPNLDSIWETTYDTVNFLHQGAFSFDEQNNPVPNGTEQLVLRLYMPAQGTYTQPYPVVMFAHGIVADRGQAGPLARTLGGYGIATVSIDLLYHGERSQGLENFPEWMWGGVRSLQVINVFQPHKFRDNFRQGVADLIWLKHLVRGLDSLDLMPFDGGDGIPDLDTENIYFAGMSLGSIHGGTLAAVEPDIDTYLFNVGAADWRTIGFYGSIGSTILKVLGLVDAFADTQITDIADINFELLRIISEGGDPYVYARYVIDEPIWEKQGAQLNILHQMAAFDETLGGPGSSQMARSMGLAQLEPYVYYIDDLEIKTPPVSEPATFMYDTRTHTILLSNGPFYDAVHLQAGTFFRTAYDNGVATIINPLE